MLKENSTKEIGELLKNVSTSVSAAAYTDVSASTGFTVPESYEDSKSITEIKNRCRLRFRFRFIDKAVPENYR